MKKLLIAVIMMVFLTGCFRTANDSNSKTESILDSEVLINVDEVANEIFDIIDREDKEALRESSYIGSHGAALESALDDILSLKEHLVGERIQQQIYIPKDSLGKENVIIKFKGFNDLADSNDSEVYNCTFATDGLESASIFYEMEKTPNSNLVVLNMLKENNEWKLSKIYIMNYKISGGDIDYWYEKGLEYRDQENYMMAYFALRHSENLIQLNDNILYENLDKIVLAYDEVVKLIPGKYEFPIKIDLRDSIANIYNIDLLLYKGAYVYQVAYQSDIPVLAENKDLFEAEAAELHSELVKAMADFTPGLATKVLYAAYNVAPIDITKTYDAFNSIIDFPLVD